MVHVDGSARPQIIARADNPTYYDILVAFERASGLPVLVNTSFNVHEEPIVNAPAECVKALVDGRVDFVVTDQALVRARRPAKRARPSGHIVPPQPHAAAHRTGTARAVSIITKMPCRSGCGAP